MRVFQYWQRAATTIDVDGANWRVSACGGSNDSLDAAARVARTNLERKRAAIAGGLRDARYGYFDRPLREEWLESIQHAGQTVAVVTRNSYGALILNAARVMFIDIDFVSAPARGVLAALLGRRAERKAEEKQIRARIQRVTTQRGMSLRVYRTANGYRLLVTNALYDPTGAETRSILEQFGSDELFIRLCAAQQCFRARLSPKPWRIDLQGPSIVFPFVDDVAERNYRAWQQRYHERAAEYSACRLVKTFGDGVPGPEVAKVLEWHDGVGCTGHALA